MRLTADDRGTDWVLRAREFAPELAAAADEIERRRELPEPIVAGLDRDLRGEPARAPIPPHPHRIAVIAGRSEHFETLGQYLFGLESENLAWL
jgi:hypothetical protein